MTSIILEKKKGGGQMGYQKGMDDLEEYPVGVRIRILAAQVNAAADLTTWCFVSKSKLFYSTSIREKEFLAFFQQIGRAHV